MSSSEMMGGDTPENSSDTTEVNNGVEGSSSESGDLEGLSPTSDDNSPIMEARKGFFVLLCYACYRALCPGRDLFHFWGKT